MTDYPYELIHDAVHIDDDEPECDGRCLTAADVGVPEAGGMYAIDPECSLHGDGEPSGIGNDCG